MQLPIPPPTTIRLRKAPPIAVPTNFEPYIKPLARPRSDSRSKSTASASTETSCSELNMLCTKTSQPIKMRCSEGRSTKAIKRIVSVIPSCAAIIQGRRRPIEGIPNRSIKGPQMNLNVHGRVDKAVTDAIAATLSPRSAKYEANVIVTNP